MIQLCSEQFLLISNGKNTYGLPYIYKTLTHPLRRGVEYTYADRCGSLKDGWTLPRGSKLVFERYGPWVTCEQQRRFNEWPVRGLLGGKFHSNQFKTTFNPPARQWNVVPASSPGLGRKTESLPQNIHPVISVLFKGRIMNDIFLCLWCGP